MWTTLFGHWLTPYTLEPVQWLLLIWLLVRWVRLRDDRLLLALGVVTGVAAMTKFQVLLLCAVVVAAVAVVVATAGRPYYLARPYARLAAAGALGLQRRRETGPSRWRWSIWPSYALSVALAVGMLMLSVSIVRSDVGEHIAQRAADAYRALPQAQRGRTAVFGESYIVAAYLDGYSKRYQLPEAYSTNRSYGYFPPPPADHDTVLYVGRDPGALRAYFADVRTVGDVGDVGEDMHAYLLTGQRQPWDQMWPQLRTLTVS